MNQEQWDLAQQMWRGQTSGTGNEPSPDFPARAVPIEQVAVEETPRGSPRYSPRVVVDTDAQVWQRAVEEVQLPPLSTRASRPCDAICGHPEGFAKQPQALHRLA